MVNKAVVLKVITERLHIVDRKYGEDGIRSSLHGAKTIRALWPDTLAFIGGRYIWAKAVAVPEIIGAVDWPGHSIGRR